MRGFRAHRHKPAENHQNNSDCREISLQVCSGRWALDFQCFQPLWGGVDWLTERSFFRVSSSWNYLLLFFLSITALSLLLLLWSNSFCNKATAHHKSCYFIRLFRMPPHTSVFSLQPPVQEQRIHCYTQKYFIQYTHLQKPLKGEKPWRFLESHSWNVISNIWLRAFGPESLPLTHITDLSLEMWIYSSSTDE